jgi:hypothetical protein
MPTIFSGAIGPAEAMETSALASDPARAREIVWRFM